MVSLKPISVISKITKAPIMEKMIYKPARENPAKFAANMALVSALTKDAVNCYYYYTQSLHNEKIPEDKRGFVASMDLVNGVLNVGMQFTIGSWITKHNGAWFDKFVGKSLDENKSTEIAKKVSDAIKAKHPNEKIEINQIKNYMKDKKVLNGLKAGGKAEWLKIGFSVITTLLGTQVFTKRVLTPLFSPPIAGWYKHTVLEKNKTPKDPEQQTPAMKAATMQPKYDNQVNKKEPVTGAKTSIVA